MKIGQLVKVAIVVAMIGGCSTVKVSAGGDGHRRDFNAVFGGVTIERGAEVRDISSVNGGVEIESKVIARDVEVVNGGVEIGDNVNLRRVSTVNGGIEAGESLVVDKTVETVNGDIHLGQGGNIGIDIISVNGDITLKGASIGNNVKTSNGDISLSNKTIVKGDIIIEKSRNFSFFGFSDNTPVINIDATSEVHGTIHLYKPVKLEIAETAKVGEVKRHYSLQ
jgi:hypothetical protein